MYNMDEKGFLLGVHNRVKVIVRHRHRPPIEKMDGSREWITVVECTCADNSMLPPLVIFKVPKRRREKLTAAVIADGDYLLQKERERGGEERVEEQRVMIIAARKAARAQTANGGSRAGASGGRWVGRGGRGLGRQRSELEHANIGE